MSELFLTDSHLQLRDEVRTFAEEVVAPQVADMEASQDIEYELARQIARRGWVGATIGKKHGGMAAGHLAKTLIISELSRVSAAMGAMVQASQLGTAKILHFGSHEQKDTLLPRIAAGMCLPTIAVTEEGSGSHVLGMQMTAERDGDSYVLNGSKVFVGNSHIGDLHGVVARTGEGSRGLTAFLVESERPGLTLPEHRRTLGLHGFSFGELQFADCRIPASSRLGDEGQGVEVAYSSSVLYGRANLTAVALGIHEAILEQTTRFTEDRIRYGQALHQLPTIKLKVGQIQSRLMTARLAAYHAAHLLDAGEPCDADLMNAKLINTESALDSARAAMEIHAAAGLMTDSPLERYLRDAFHIFAPAGTSDIQLLRLAEVALGQAKSPWSQRLSAAKTPALT
ncbi:acyl-CoA dehydrogenase family protein [Streptomyces sp. NBC_01304]|uniref:acyl-CoA dehydrogenase family protein n=1 Tax=Streptomyces sp. NBC_01304 TaxID=2903818 RepID=UPI002E14F01E|nr:acyl-CoA dehydrogenase family protein [Streptomyces sp. NBC_01304]